MIDKILDKALPCIYAALGVAAIVAVLSVPITSIQNALWLASVDMPVGLGTVIRILVNDFAGFALTLTMMMVMAFSLAMPVAALTKRFVPVDPKWWYGLAGAVGVGVALYLSVVLLFEIQGVAGNRSWIGKILHIAVGFAGGYLFGWFWESKPNQGQWVLAGFPLVISLAITTAWIIDPVQAMAGFGFDFASLESNAQNAAIRDFTAFFVANSAFIVLGTYTLQPQWYWASAILFGSAGVFNLAASQIHGTEPVVAANVFEFVFVALNLGLARLAKRAQVAAN